ncbi:membrane protein [Clostridium sp. DMHC 10]|nr:membrane protein [Clostridium sp. DMHC 10]
MSNEDIPINKIKIHFKDFLALTIASIQVLVPIFLAIFAVFVLLAFLLMKFWVK